MIWNAFKTIITTLCLLLATLFLVTSPFNFAGLAFACFVVFMGVALWIDFTKPISAQNLTPTQRNIAKVAIWGLIIFFVTMFINSIFNGESQLNGSSFVQLITALLKAM